MRKSKFEYFVNAVMYNLGRFADASIGELALTLKEGMQFLIKSILPKNLRIKYEARIEASEKYVPSLRRSLSLMSGLSTLKFFSVVAISSGSFFLILISWHIKKAFPALERVPLEIFGSVIPLLSIVPIFVIIFDDDTSDVYYRLFDRMNPDWHVKWRLITLVLSICIVAAPFIAIKLAMITVKNV